MQRDLRIGIADGKHTVDIESLWTLGTLGKFPQEHQKVHNNEGVSDDGVVFRLDTVTNRDHGTLFFDRSGRLAAGILPIKNKPPEMPPPGDVFRMTVHSTLQ